MGGYLDRPNMDIEIIKDFLKAEMSRTQPASSQCVGYQNALEKLEELHRFKRDYHSALVRNDELIREARSELAVEVAHHYATKVCLEKAEMIVARLHMERARDHAGGAGRDREAGEDVCHQPQGHRLEGCCRGQAHPKPACGGPANEAGEGSRVPTGGDR